MDNFDHHLPGLNRTDNLFADGLFLDFGNEFLYHRQRNISFQQRNADFAHGVVNVLFAQNTPGGNFGKDGTQFICQRFKNRFIPSAYKTRTYILLHAGGGLSANLSTSCPETAMLPCTRFKTRTYILLHASVRTLADWRHASACISFGLVLW